MSKVSEGYKKEKLARDNLVAEGYNIVFKSVRWRRGCIDFAGLFDIVAVKGKVRRNISVKHFGDSNYYLPHQEDIRRWKEEYGLKGETFELWLWVSPRWEGRGKDKKYTKGYWKIINIE